MTVEVAVKQLADALDTLLAVELGSASRGELLELARGLETQRRRLPVADHALIGELDARAVAGELACASTAALLMQLLRITPGEAKARVRAAGDLGARRTLTGDLLPPVFPAVAAAQAEGAISDRHAAVIRPTVHALPAAAAEQAEQVEAALTGHAQRLDPDQLGKAARRLLACLDPDGTRPDDADHARRRDLTLTRLSDGSARLSGYLTPGCTAVTEAWLDALAAPVPAADGEPDRRTGGQRRHDAFEDLGRRALRGGELPDCGGTPATVLLTITLADLESRAGLATTSHGGLITVPEALRLAGEADLIPVVLTDTGGILAMAGHAGSPHLDSVWRWPPATAAVRSRRATGPRPGRKPTTSSRGIDGGPTDLDNLTLVCGFHHREFAKRGWACHITDGLPTLDTPSLARPRSSDPDATPPTTP